MINDEWQINVNHQQNDVHGGSEDFQLDSGSGRGCLGLTCIIEIIQTQIYKIQTQIYTIQTQIYTIQIQIYKYTNIQIQIRDSGSGRGCLGLAWTVEIIQTQI